VGFHPTLVLAQPVSGRLSISIQRFHPTLVLAQREQARRDKASGILFPSHIGSRSTNMADGLFGEVQEFPSHIGSRSTVYRWATGPAAYLSFPSHIGSRSTNQPARKRFGYVRFHPTLVLAQKSRPSSVVPEHGPVLRKGEKRRERERVREKRERKWGLTGS